MTALMPARIPAPIPADMPDIPRIAAEAAATKVPVVPAYAVLPRVRRPLAAASRALIALTAAAGVTITLFAGSPLRALTHFTIQSGILAAAVFALSSGRAWTARRPLPPSLTTGTLLYVTAAGVFHHVILANGSPAGGVDPLTGWQALSNQLLHTALPLAAALDWLLLTRPAPLRPHHAAVWLLFLVAHLTFTMAHGALLPPNDPTGSPYSFLDPTHHGYIGALSNATILTLTCYTLALLLIAVDHIRPGPRRRPSKTGFRLQPPVG
ncbi:Pr6Pr family membrane protein [Streptomyces pseudoechinosporeus]